MTAPAFSKECGRSERLPFHWGMTMAVYPFWRVVADITGDCSGFRVRWRRPGAEAGQGVAGGEEVVARSARYVLRAFADWGVIDDSAGKGEYSPVPRRSTSPTREWRYGCSKPHMLAASEASVDFGSLVNGPSLFPFQIGRVIPRTTHGIRPPGRSPARAGEHPIVYAPSHSRRGFGEKEREQRRAIMGRAEDLAARISSGGEAAIDELIAGTTIGRTLPRFQEILRQRLRCAALRCRSWESREGDLRVREL